MSLEQLRADFLSAIEGKGVHCPCCDRWAKVNGYTFNKSMARSLVWLVNQSNKGARWVNVPQEAPKELLRTYQLATVRHWGLIESLTNNGQSKSCGLWRPTPMGIRFVDNDLSIPSKAFVYNSRLRGFGTDCIYISNVYKNFNYQEQLEATYDEGTKHE